MSLREGQMKHLIHTVLAAVVLIAGMPAKMGLAKDAPEKKSAVYLISTDGWQAEGFTAPYEIRLPDKKKTRFFISPVSEFESATPPEDWDARMHWPVRSDCLAAAARAPESPGQLEAAGGAALVSIFTSIVKAFVKVAFSNADKDLEKKLKSFKAEYKPNAAFYAVRHKPGTASIIRPNWTCFRAVRLSYWQVKGKKDGKEETETKAEIDFDVLTKIAFVGGTKESGSIAETYTYLDRDSDDDEPKETKVNSPMDYFKGSAGMQFVPLRVHTKMPRAKGEIVRYGVSAKGSDLMLDQKTGKPKQLFEVAIASGAYALKGRGDKRTAEDKTSYFQLPIGLQASDIYSNLPLLPIPGQLTPKAGAGNLSGAFNMQLTISEAGKGPSRDALENWRAFLSNAKDGVSEATATAIGGLFEDE